MTVTGDLSVTGSAPVDLGMSPSNPARNCSALHAARPSLSDGPYWIKPATSGPAFQAWCDMSSNGGGWTLCFSYDNSQYDSYNWPTIAESRDKMFAKTWGDAMLSGNGTRQGNFCNQFEPLTSGTTQIRGEVVKVADGAVLMSGLFTIQKTNFFTQTHNNTTGQFDCLVDSTGNQRLLYANYFGPSKTYNRTLKGACTGSTNDHLTLAALDTSTGNFGIDGLLVLSAAPSGLDTASEISLHVNWYSDISTQTLYTTTSSTSTTKFGVTATWYVDRHGRQGASPGPQQRNGECGHTNVVNNTFKQRIWIK